MRRAVRTAGLRRARRLARSLRIACWNVNGLRSVLRHEADPLRRFVASARPDVLALSETKVDAALLPAFEGLLPGYDAHWACCSTKKGYSGTAVFTAKALRARVAPGDSRLAPRGRDDAADARLNTEGRLLVAELERCVVVHTYVPNAGAGLGKLGARLDWDAALAQRLRELAARHGDAKPLVWCGDLNVAHGEWDVHNPKLRDAPGYSLPEREGFGRLVGGLPDRPSALARVRDPARRPSSAVPGGRGGGRGGGRRGGVEGGREGSEGEGEGEGGHSGHAPAPFFDAWRALHPHPREVASAALSEEPCPFTYFSARGRAREKGKGWRLDYCVLAEALRPRLRAAHIHADVPGSDHLPISVDLDFERALR